MYSVRDAVDKDLAAAVARVRAIGFKNIEPYAFIDKASAYSKAMASDGVAAPSGHASVIDSKDPSKAFDAAKTLGMEIVIDPFIPTERWQTADDAKKLAERVNELAAQAKSHGLKFGYHNHQWEWTNKAGGRPVFEHFVDHLSPDVVLEVDTYWATVGGVDPVEKLQTLGGRVVAIHVKDGKVDGDILTSLPSSESALIVPEALKRAFEQQTPAGQGDVNVSGILKAAPQAIRVVEFDAYSGDIFDGIAESYKWLQTHDATGVF